MARDQRKQYDSTQNFVASSQVSFDLNRDNPIQEILLLGEFQFATTAGGSIAATPEASPWTCIKSIQLVANGADVVKSYDGAMLYDLNYFDFGIVPPIENFQIGASTDTGLMKSGLIISLEALGMALPQHTWLDGRLLSSLELRLIFGTTADIGTITNPTGTDINRYTCFGKEILDIAPQSVFAVNQETMSVSAFPTTSATQRRFRQNIGNAYRRFVIQTRDSSSRQVVDRLTKIALLEQGSFYRRSMPASAWKILNSFRRSAVGVDLNSGGTRLTQHPVYPIVAAGGPTTGESGGYRLGTYLIDIAEDGSENALLNTLGYSSLDLELDWNGSNTTDLIRILSSTYVPQIR